MKVKFCMVYKTQFGQNVILKGNCNDKPFVLKMRTQDGNLWTAENNFENAAGISLKYHYEVIFEDNVIASEWDECSHKINLEACPSYYLAYDTWLDMSKDQYLYSAAGNCFFPNHTPISNLSAKFDKTLFIYADIAILGDDDKLLFCSNQNDWNIDKAIEAKRTSRTQVGVELNIDEIKFPLEYKFVIAKSDGGIEPIWQMNGNYVLNDFARYENMICAIDNLRPLFNFKKPKVAGVILPVFSLRTEKDFGVGDFGSLKLFIDWAVKCGLRAIQILPVNDTTTDGGAFDSSPYTGISVFALHPVYADISRLPIEKNDEYFSRQKELNASPDFDYIKTNALKQEYLKQAFYKEGKEVLASDEFKAFFCKNKFWLEAYAAFRVLSEENKTTDFSKWTELNVYDEKSVSEFCSEGHRAYEQVSFHFYVQYILHIQLLEASNYAKEKNVMLKGDIPIGVSACSVDTWQYPKYFDRDFSAGAPPDLFSMQGQNWGFPIYNWHNMKEDNYSWWQNRLKQMAQYFDAYRVDHILGFFRIWEVAKTDVFALDGEFNPALAMTKEEIESFGFKFDEKYLKSFISDEMLEEVFEDQKDEIAERFLQKLPSGLYEFKKEFATQKDVGALDISEELKEKLHFLACDVLFLRDFRNPDKYHPRIFAYTDYIFKQLTPEDQEAFKRLDDYYYYKRNNDLWYESALSKLPALLHSTNMLMCAEDLGMIPTCVPKVLEELQILGLEVERQPKRGKDLIADVSKFPYLSVCSISTHDLSMLREFWTERPEVTDFYYHKVLDLKGDVPKDLPVELSRRIVKRNLKSTSILCLFLFGDWVTIDEDFVKNNWDKERINVPGTIENNWRYRLHFPIEELLKMSKLNNDIKNLVTASGRG